MDDKRELFMSNAVLSLAVGNAHRVRNGMPIYSARSSKEERNRFSIDLWQKLDDLNSAYNFGVSEPEHLENIENLSDDLSIMHNAALHDGRYRIGVAQRALNLSLKYWWCMDRIPCPPHCPFDRKIIIELRCRGYLGPDWTELDSIEDYYDLVCFAKNEANGEELAIWELIKFLSYF